MTNSQIVPKPNGFALAYIESIKALGSLRPAAVPNQNFDGLYAAIEQESRRNAGTVRPPKRTRKAG